MSERKENDLIGEEKLTGFNFSNVPIRLLNLTILSTQHVRELSHQGGTSHEGSDR